MSDIDIGTLPVILEFLKIHKEQGPAAAIRWAEKQTAINLGESESSDKKPDLRIVR